MISGSFASEWRKAWTSNHFRIQWLISLLVLAGIAFVIPHFFSFIQQREGRTLNDPLLNLLQPKDHSAVTFSLIYGALILSIIALLVSPHHLLLFVESYCLTTIFRMATIYLVPLNDPHGLIVLRDPFVNLIGYGGQVITKDLFFSGHVSTLFLLMLTVHQKVFKWILFFIMLSVASLILLQHVHYTIDVIAAPFFASIAWWIAKRSFNSEVH